MDDLQKAIDYKLFSIADHDLTVGQIVIIPLFILVAYLALAWLVRTTVAAMGRREINADIIHLVRRGMYVLGLIVLGITALDLLNVPLTAFAFISGAVAIGFGFGAQNIINNFISGWILIWERPIRIHDYIEVGESSGTVEEINTRSTRVRRVDGVHMLIPNSKLLEETVVNWTLVDRLLRCIVRVGVCYGSDVAKVKELLKQTAANHPLILKEPPPQIIFEDFGDSALIFDTYFWVYSAGEKGAREIRSDFRFEVDRLFQMSDVVIAFPQRDIHVDGLLRIEDESKRKL